MSIWIAWEAWPNLDFTKTYLEETRCYSRPSKRYEDFNLTEVLRDNLDVTLPKASDLGNQEI